MSSKMNRRSIDEVFRFWPRPRPSSSIGLMPMAKSRRVPTAIIHILFVLCLMFLLPTCNSQELNASLSSTESTITLEWNVESNATFYQVTWHRSVGIFLLDEYYYEPFNTTDGKLTFNLVGLLPGVPYTFILFRNGNSTNDKIFHSDIITVPLPPENLQVLNRTSSSIFLTWEPGFNSSQSHYEVEYQANGAIQTIFANSSTDPLTFNLTDLMPGHTYLLSMRAVSGNKRSNSSAAVTAVTAPAMPVNVNVSAVSTNSLMTIWEAGNNSLQDSFEVQYSLSGEDTQRNANCTASPCEFEVIGIPGQLYTISIYAVKQNFRSKRATVEHNTAPATPRNLTAVSGVRSLQLTWDVPQQGVFDSFRVSLTNTLDTREVSYPIHKQDGSTSYSYSPTGLKGGVNFFVRVYSVTLTEESMDSASHLYYTLPESVTSLSGQALNTTAVQLSWQNPLNSVYTGLELNVTSAAGASFTFSPSAGEATYAVGSLDPGVEYTAVMVVISKVQANSAAVNTSVRTKPEPPQLIATTLLEESINVTFSGGQNPNGIFDSISARLVEDGTLLKIDGEGTIEFKNLTPGSQYTLEAYTRSGVQVSTTLTQFLYTKPRPPQNLSIEVVSSEQLLITWEGPDRGNADNYTITLVAAHGGEVPVTDVVNGTTYSFSSAHPGETYNISVVANKGTESSEAVSTQDTTTPLPLMHVRVSMKGTNFAVISWDTPSGSVFDGFAYDFPFLNKTLEELAAFPLNVKLETLEPNSNYTVKLYVFSRHVDGRLLYSEATAFNFSTYPESVAALQKVNATTGSITVNWTAPVSGTFRMFQLGINPPDSPKSVDIVSSSQTEYTFGNLTAGKNYTVAIRTVIALNSFGIAVRLQAVTKPLPVLGLTVETSSSEELKVIWSVDSNSFQDRFTITQERDGMRKSYQLEATEGQGNYMFVVNQLLAGETYTVTVTATREIDTDIEESEPVSQTGTTNPSPVENLSVIERIQTVTVTWQKAAGSKQDMYRIKYRPVLRDPNAPWLEQTSVTETTQFSQQAFPGEEYQVLVFAVSNGQESVASNASLVVAPFAPNMTLMAANTTLSSVTITWNHDPSITYVEYWNLMYRDSQMSNNFNITNSDSSNVYTRVLSSLTSGVTYTVEMFAVVKGVKSVTVILDATAKPKINTNIIEIPAETTNTKLSFEYNVVPGDRFDSFRFMLVGVHGQSPVTKGKQDSDRSVSFTGLQGGTVYTVEAVTVSDGVVSDAIRENILTVPNNVVVEFQNRSSEIVINFASLEGSATKYSVGCLTPNNAECWSEEVAAGTGSITIDNLQPYTTYSLVVKTIAGGVDVSDKSVEKTYSVQTAEAAPSEVRLVTASEDGLRTVQLTWTQPLALNGQLKSYRLVYTGSHSNGDLDSVEENQIPSTSTSIRLTNLKAGFTYVFQVQARTVTLGPAGEATLTLSTDVPMFKSGNTAENSKPVLSEQGSAMETSLKIEMTNAFSDSNGPILGYTIIVSTDVTADTSKAVLASWKEARDDGSISTYQATKRCSDLFLLNSLCGKSSTRTIRAVNGQDSVVFHLGMQSAEECKGIQFCNGPLKAGTDYYVKLRAFTQAGFTDTEYSSKIRTADAPTSSSAAIIGATIGVLVILIIVVLLVIFIIRKKRQPKRATKYRGSTSAARQSWDSSSLKNFRESGIRRFRQIRDRMGMFAMHLLHINSQQLEENGSTVFDRKYYSTFNRRASRPVKLREFTEHVSKMAADSDFKYAEEYEDLKDVGRDQTCHAAELPANRPKNRFTNILPYDQSRVKLLPTDDEEGSDYINANYMPGFRSKREYIATQGPLPATRDDFWRMVWEQSSHNIVMLTKCMEKGREKSDHYWPADSEPKFYGDLQVVILNETHLPDWTITEFRVCLGDACRQVRHFHYKAWPDFGVPKNHSSLIRFVRTVREKLIREGGPIVTHCSAGVGRSGTFIVLDHCLQLVREKDEVDIFRIVYNLRKERVLMVQTEQQYKFVHESLACVLEGREDDTTYANLGQLNIGFEDDEGINVEVPS